MNLSVWSCGVNVTQTFISKHSKVLDAYNPLYCLSLTEDNEGGTRRRHHNTNPVLVIFVTLAVRSMQSIKWMLNMFISQCTEVFFLVVWLLVLKAWSWGWLSNVLGGCVLWGTFISCMLVAPHSPTYSGKGITGGRGASIKGLKVHSNHLCIATLGLLYLHTTLAGVFSLNFYPIAGCIVLKYCETTTMLLSLVVLRCSIFKSV